ncbi:MAG: hypothetical protein ACYDA5_10485 [Vulcanimicrobiaceae bacterium]
MRWGPLGKNGGIAYVGFLSREKRWIYDDYHYDGAFFRDFSSGPGAKGNWRWFGTSDQVHVDPAQGPVTWRRTSPTQFRQTYRGSKNGRVVDYGYSDCVRT